jgi:hypothetical protein
MGSERVDWPWGKRKKFRFSVGLCAAAVVHVDGDRAEDALHGQVAEAQMGDCPTSAAPRLDPNASIRSLKPAILDRDLADAACGLAADDDTTMPPFEEACADADSFRRPSLAQPALAGARLDGDTVVADVDGRMFDADVRA